MSKDTATPSWDDLRAKSLPNRRDREDAKREQRLLDRIETLERECEALKNPVCGLTKTEMLRAIERAFVQTYLEKVENNGGAIDEADASEWFYEGWASGFRYRAQMFNVKGKK